MFKDLSTLSCLNSGSTEPYEQEVDAREVVLRVRGTLSQQSIPTNCIESRPFRRSTDLCRQIHLRKFVKSADDEERASSRPALTCAVLRSGLAPFTKNVEPDKDINVPSCERSGANSWALASCGVGDSSMPLPMTNLL